MALCQGGPDLSLCSPPPNTPQLKATDLEMRYKGGLGRQGPLVNLPVFQTATATEAGHKSRQRTAIYVLNLSTMVSNLVSCVGLGRWAGSCGGPSHWLGVVGCPSGPTMYDYVLGWDQPPQHPTVMISYNEWPNNPMHHCPHMHQGQGGYYTRAPHGGRSELY